MAERPYGLEFPGGRRAWIQIWSSTSRVRRREIRRARDEIKSAFTAVWTGLMDSDSFNQLTLTAGVPWRLVVVLRAYLPILLQTGLPFSQGYIAQVLINIRRSRAILRICS